MRALWELMRGQRLRYAMAVAALAVATFLLYARPLIVRAAVDSFIGDKPLAAPGWALALIDRAGGRSMLAANLWIAGLALVAVTAVGGVFSYLKGRWAAIASETVVRRLRDRVYDHLQRLPCGYHDKTDTGDLVQRCTSDVETVYLFVSMQVVEIGRAGLLLATALPLMLYLSPAMSAVSMAMMAPILIFALVYFTRIRGAFLASDEAEARMTGILQENITGIRVVRAFARQDFEIDKFNGGSGAYRDLDYRLLRLLSVYWSASDAMCFAQRGLVLFVGAWMVRRGAMTLGDLVAFWMFVEMFLWPVRRIGRVLTDLGKALVSLGRLQEFLDEPPENADEAAAARPAPGDAPPGDAPPGDAPAGEVVFDGVEFANGDTRVLRGVSFSVAPGEVLAILGPSGAGKSTIVNLLLRFYAYDGSIRLDGVELRDIPRTRLRRRIAVVMQEPFLYSKTLRDNIRLSHSAAGESEIIEVAQAACIHDAISRFDQGYDTLIGERGVTLSGGQRQRVALAQAILKDAPVLVLDDAFSAVDTRTEATILSALANRRGRRTSIVIAHRLTTLAHADRVIVLDAGRVVQSGTPQELLRQEGFYRRLWEIQNAPEEEIIA
jgi:ATP-binding cassette subfamily B protein